MKTLILPILLFFAQACFAQEVWKKFETSELQSGRESSQRPYLQFLSENSFSMGIYELKAGSIDGQPTHKEDEVYVIMAGEAKLVAGDSTFSVKPGSVLFVRAEIEHRFVEIESNLSVLVIFSKTPSNPGDPDAISWTVEKLRGAADPNQNVWDQFLFVSTMRMGLYILPQKLGGDQALTHKVDEINIVTKGTATFKVGEDEIEVKPGTIVWVREGNPHLFQNLSEDFDVLIAFHIKP